MCNVPCEFCGDADGCDFYKKRCKMKILIRSNYGDWKEVSLQQAVSFYEALSDIARRKFFDNHFKGVSREELEAERKRN